MLHPMKTPEAPSQVYITNISCKALGEHIKVFKNLNFKLTFAIPWSLPLQEQVEKGTLESQISPKAEMYPWQTEDSPYLQAACC